MATKLLLVDDDPVLRAEMQRLATSLGHEALAVQGGRNAVTRLEAESFDLLVVDLHMPDTDGFAIIEAARRARPATAVLALTGAETVKDAVAALRAGAADFLPKPAHPALFTETVHRILRER